MSVRGAQSTAISAALSGMLEEAKRWNKADLERQNGDHFYCFKWDCVAHETVLRKGIVEKRSEWTEAAYHFDWEKLFGLALQDSCPTTLINTTRLQRTENITSGNGRPLSGFTALHQAAWQGAPVEVVQGLLDLGAYSTFTHTLPYKYHLTTVLGWVRTTDGRNNLPVDVARLRGHSHLYDILEPPNYLPKWTQKDLKSIERHFYRVIEERTDWITDEAGMRLPNLEVLREIKGRMYMAVPGMYGVSTCNHTGTTSYNGDQGFGFQLEGDHLVVESNCRVVGGSGMTHHITPLGVTIANEGWG